MKKTRLFCALLVTLTLAFSLFSCSETTPAVSEGYLLIDGQKTTPDWIIKLDETEISFAEYRHFFLSAKTDLDQGTEGYFTEYPEAEEELKETVLAYLKESHALLKLAEEYGVNLTAQEKNDLSEERANTKSELGEELYASMLTDYFLTDELYLSLLENNALYDKTYETLIGENGTIHITDEELSSYLNENYFCYAQIYVDFRSGEGTITHEATDRLVEEIQTRLNAGDDFYAVAFSHSDDQTMMDYKNGYLKPKAELSEAKLAALDTLSEGEISEPILESDGYYILKRMPISDAVTEENREYVLYGYTDLNENHTNGLYEDRFYALISQTAETFSITYADCYPSISTQTLS